MRFRNSIFALSVWIGSIFASGNSLAELGDNSDSSLPVLEIETLHKELRVGDIVFTHIDILPFRKIAYGSGSWVNHVGIIIDTAGNEALVAESIFPFSKATKFSQFIARSKDGRVRISRLHKPLTPKQQSKIISAANARFGRFYDTGFNLYSSRQFCSRYVREVVEEGTGIQLGKIETLSMLFSENKNASEDLNFWRVWYFGKIPWDRKTVTPASVMNSKELLIIFDGYAEKVSTPRRKNLES